MTCRRDGLTTSIAASNEDTNRDPRHLAGVLGQPEQRRETDDDLDADLVGEGGLQSRPGGGWQTEDWFAELCTECDAVACCARVTAELGTVSATTRRWFGA